jgi:hypothetical protein
MGLYLGYHYNGITYNDDFSAEVLMRSEAGRTALDLGLYPDQEVVSDAEWQAIVDFYLNESPDTLLTSDRKAIAKTDIFNAKKVQLDKQSFARLSFIGADSSRIFVGNSRDASLQMMDYDWNEVKNVPLNSAPVDLSFGNDLAVLEIGNFEASDQRKGRLINLSNGSHLPLLDSLSRPVHAQLTDLNHDGQEEWLICEFGSLRGGLSWYLPRGGQWEKKILWPEAGALRVVIHDINEDQKDDILLQLAHAREGVLALVNQGDGRFTRRWLLQLPPSFGSSDMSLHDFNRDGYPDILYANGDNADLSPELKPYHGVRVFLNDGNWHFRETYFFPQHGAYAAQAADFDGDGDLDIVSAAYFGEYEHNIDRTLVYLENTSSGEDMLEFNPYSLPESGSGRWIALEVADLNHDKRPDILVANHLSYQGTKIPYAVRDHWSSENVSVLVLYNNLANL